MRAAGCCRSAVSDKRARTNSRKSSFSSTRQELRSFPESPASAFASIELPRSVPGSAGPSDVTPSARVNSDRGRRVMAMVPVGSQGVGVPTGGTTVGIMVQVSRAAVSKLLLLLLLLLLDRRCLWSILL